MAPNSPDFNLMDGIMCGGAMLEKYHNLQPKPKNNKRIEGRIGVDLERFISGTHQKGHQKIFKETIKKYVGTGGGHTEHKL